MKEEAKGSGTGRTDKEGNRAQEPRVKVSGRLSPCLGVRVLAALKSRGWPAPRVGGDHVS